MALKLVAENMGNLVSSDDWKECIKKHPELVLKVTQKAFDAN